MRAARSVDIGCVRLTERCLPDDPPTAEQVEKARAVTAEILAGAFAAVPVEGVRTWVGVAGTVTTLSALAMGLPAYDADVIHLSRLSLPDLHRVDGRPARHAPRASGPRSDRCTPGGST